MTFEFYCNTCRDKKHYIQGHRAFCADCEDHLGDTEKLEAQNKIMREALERISLDGDGIAKDCRSTKIESLTSMQIEYEERMDLAKEALEKVKELDEK